MGQEIVRQFHELYYNTGLLGGTWNDTHWMGVKTQKCPLDLWIYQEIMFEIRPEAIVECGTKWGGSALFLAHICELIGRGHVLTIDIENHSIPCHERLSRLIGSSTHPVVMDHVRSFTVDRGPVLVILDSDHRAGHVLNEMRTYSTVVTPGSYLIVEDTNLNGHPVVHDHGPGPMEAVQTFLRENPQFTPDRTREKLYLTFNPRGYLRRVF